MAVQRAIAPEYFSGIPKMRETLGTLPEDIRICPQHGEEIRIIESDPIPVPGDGASFGEAAFTGCCETAVDNAINGIRRAWISK